MFHFRSIFGRFEIVYFSSGATEVCLEFYDARNVTVREGETAIFGCPLEDKCLADSVEWFELDANGDRQPLKDSRVEIFSFDPLLMWLSLMLSIFQFSTDFRLLGTWQILKKVTKESTDVSLEMHKEKWKAKCTWKWFQFLDTSQPPREVLSSKCSLPRSIEKRLCVHLSFEFIDQLNFTWNTIKKWVWIPWFAIINLHL